ncbi:MAG: glycosyltransferase [Actinobacteria bacterium]|nr:glycosyltransferase [Chloroflexota bacterium]MCL5292270.1 glycosyltransferase [Actinomycetota bacterium]
MLTTVPIGTKSISQYEEIVGGELINRLKEVAYELANAKILHLSSTAFGGGVAELLYTLVPLTRDLGLDVDWKIIYGSDDFFTCTKLFHNALQGMDLILTKDMVDIYNRQNDYNADMFQGRYDFVMVHDPQPAAILKMLEARGRRSGKWIWRCHIDLTDANMAVWEFLKPYLDIYDAAIFTMPQYVKEDLFVKNVKIVAPTIDPLSPKNMEIELKDVESVLARYSIDPVKPIITQVSRFDPWKDPLGVIDAFRIAKKKIPEIQLLMIASMATDDPEGWHYYEKTSRHAAGDKDIHLLSNFEGVGNLEVNAFQRASDIVVQKSIREGFGLVVSEALWKEKPVIGGNVGGIPIQIIDGRNGYLIDTVDECADRIMTLLTNKNATANMGAAGKEHVRKNFLSPRQLVDYLELFAGLAA